MNIITSPQLFPAIIIGLFACAAIRYSFDQDWPQVGYYVGAIILNVAVIGMSK